MRDLRRKEVLENIGLLAQWVGDKKSREMIESRYYCKIHFAAFKTETIMQSSANALCDIFNSHILDHAKEHMISKEGAIFISKVNKQ